MNTEMGIVPASGMTNVGLDPAGWAATNIPSGMAKVIRQLKNEISDSSIETEKR